MEIQIMEISSSTVPQNLNLSTVLSSPDFFLISGCSFCSYPPVCALCYSVFCPHRLTRCFSFLWGGGSSEPLLSEVPLLLARRAAGPLPALDLRTAWSRTRSL